MKLVICTTTLLILVSTTWSFQCDDVFYGRDCGGYKKASKSLNKVVEATDYALTDVLQGISKDVSKIFQKYLQNGKGIKIQITKIGNDSKVTVNGNITVDEALEIVSEFMKTLKDLKDFDIFNLGKLQEFNKKITELIKNALNQNTNAYLILDKVDLAQLKEQLRNALASVNAIARGLILRAVDRFHNSLITLGDYIRPLLTAAGKEDVYLIVQSLIRAAIEKAKAKVGGYYALEIGSHVEQAEQDLSGFIDGIDNQAPIVKRGLNDLWSKVQAALDGLGDDVKDVATKLVNKYKPKIMESLEKVKKMALDGAKSLLLELQGDIVKILKGDEKHLMKRAISDLWAKVKEAAKNLGDNIKNKVTVVLENYKPKVLDALNNVKKVVIDGVKQIVVEFNNGVVKILTDGQTATSDGNLYAFDDTHYEAYVVIDDSPVQGYAFGDVWNKIKEKVKSLGDKVKARTKELIEKYKPKILNTIDRVKQFIIDEGQKLIIELKGDLVEVILKETETKVEKRSITDLWAKVKEAAKNLGDNIKNKVTDVLENYKPKVLDALNNVKKVVIDGVKQIVVEFNNGVVKILTDGQTATSDGNLYAFDDTHYEAYVVIDDSPVQGYAFGDVWNKIKEKVKSLGDKVKARTKELIEKYKPKILNTIDRVKQFIIDEGQKLIIELKGDLVEVILKETETKVEKRSITDLWAKVKEAAKNLGDNIKNKVTDVLENYKPKVLDALNNVKKVVIDGVKQIVVEFNNGVVKILTDGQTATSDGNLYAFDDTHYEAYVVIDDSPVQGYAFGDVWNKIKEKVKSLGDKVKARTKELIEKYKPKILNTIDRVKQFIIDEGQKLIIELKGDLVEVILKETETKVEKRSITDLWAKVKEAAKNLGDNIKNKVTDVLENYKPKVLDALNNVKKVVIDGVKQIVVEFNNGVVKILTDGQTATSDGNLYAFDDTHYEAYVVIDDSPVQGYAFGDVWNKIKEKVKSLGDQLKEKSKALIEKYKPKIIDSINKVKQFIIEEGQKVIIELKGDLINIAVKEIALQVEKRALTDLWGKIKEAAKNLGDNIKATVTDVLDKYKPKVIDALNNVKKVVIDGAKLIIVEVNNGIVKIMTDGQTATSDGNLYAFDDVHHDIYVVLDDPAISYSGLGDIWGKVQSAVNQLRGTVTDNVLKVVDEYKPKVIKALKELQKVVIDASKQIVIVVVQEVNGAIVKVLVDGLEGVSS